MDHCVWVRIIVTGCIVAMLTGCSEETDPQDKKVQFSFDPKTVSQQAIGWVAAETNGKGTPAVWRIVRDGFAPSPPHVMAVIKTENYGQTYNLMVAHSGVYRDLELSAYVRSGKGKEDQGGGVLWRAQNPENYYLARWNPLEKNFRVYVVRNGRRRQLASMDTRTDSRLWQRIFIIHQGDRITAVLNDEEPLVLEDQSIRKAGNVGLWTKADAATFFDEVIVHGLDDVSD